MIKIALGKPLEKLGNLNIMRNNCIQFQIEFNGGGRKTLIAYSNTIFVIIQLKF
jgi:hypothetical protein